MTENHYLFDTINKIRNERLKRQIESLERGSVHAGHVQVSDVLAKLASSVGGESNEDQEVTDMIDFLSAYWKVAMKRYVDSAIMAITEEYTSPARIVGLEDELTGLLLEASDGTLAQLLEQSTEQMRHRSELLGTRSRMIAAKARIDSGAVSGS